jgi:hypothetical protein
VTQDWSILERLGRVDEPPPAVLDAAREALWAAVAEEMLSSHEPGAVGESQRATERKPGQPRQAHRRRPDPHE